MHSFKVKILKDMCTKLHHIKDDVLYLQKYYPLDYALRNKGFLTLVSPNYVEFFSRLLKSIKTKVLNTNEDSKVSVPDKKEILQSLKGDDTYVKLVKDMAQYSVSRVAVSEVNVDSRITLVWELIDRVLNALVGDQVRQYRSNYLTRVNDQKFRSELAIIEEKGVKKFKNN